MLGQNYDNCQLAHYLSGRPEIEAYYLNSKYHRTNGPAYLQYFQSGQIWISIFYINGKKHNANGPAETFYVASGKIQKEQYFINGLRHRMDGPAEIWYYENGTIEEETYYINGQTIEVETFARMIVNAKNKTATLLQILKNKPELAKFLLNIFPDEFHKDVVDNINLFI